MAMPTTAPPVPMKPLEEEKIIKAVENYGEEPTLDRRCTTRKPAETPVIAQDPGEGGMG